MNAPRSHIENRLIVYPEAAGKRKIMLVRIIFVSRHPCIIRIACVEKEVVTQ